MVWLVALTCLVGGAGARIHSISDMSHEFTFYMDGRFFQQYIREENGADARNWGTLYKLDLSNVNLLVLSSGPGPVRYHPRSIRKVQDFVSAGGAALIMSDASGTKTEAELPIQALAIAFGARFSRTPAQLPATAAPELQASSVECRPGCTLELTGQWDVLVADSAHRPLMARKQVGKGYVVVAARGLFGQQPDARDPINASWITPLLQRLVVHRPVDPAAPPKGQFAELTRKLDSLTVEFNEGTRPYADAIAREYFIVREHLCAITGVDPSPGTLTNLLLLPTGGGGFSSGDRIGIGAWWGGYPKNRYPMIELIGHEAGHSWVLPHPEPVWNEPIATYLGIQVGKRMNMPEAEATLRRAIDAARKLDPDFTKVDISAANTPYAALWGKTFWFFEELERMYGPGVMAKYFRAKRKWVPATRPRYTLDDCVAVWSRAVGHDLFPWFRQHGLPVDASRTDLASTQYTQQ